MVHYFLKIRNEKLDFSRIEFQAQRKMEIVRSDMIS